MMTPSHQARLSSRRVRAPRLVPSGGARPTRRSQVLVLGARGVGKSSLAAAFTGAGECVKRASRGMEAFLLVYSVTERASFERASELRIGLRRGGGGGSGGPSLGPGGSTGPKGATGPREPPVILVGNKSDLVRSREVSEEEGRACAAVFDCKFIETSAALSVNVSELFQGAVRQVRLRSGHAANAASAPRSSGAARPRSRSTSTVATASSSSSSSSSRPRRESMSERARRVLGRLVAAAPSGAFKAKSRSCHDLSVL
ncbi:GTP-binding protein RAD-like [Lampetra fluviatilis]